MYASVNRIRASDDVLGAEGKKFRTSLLDLDPLVL